MRLHLCVKEARMAIIHDFVEVILKMTEEKNIRPITFADIVEHLPIIYLKLKKAHLGSKSDL